MNKTKKMLVSFDVKANEFLVPNPNSNGNMIGIKSGREYVYGAISYIGREISVNDIIDKLISSKIFINNIEEYESILVDFIDEIYRYKISNIVTSQLSKEKKITLIKVANRPSDFK